MYMKSRQGPRAVSRGKNNGSCVASSPCYMRKQCFLHSSKLLTVAALLLQPHALNVGVNDGSRPPVKASKGAAGLRDMRQSQVALHRWPGGRNLRTVRAAAAGSGFLHTPPIWNCIVGVVS